MAGDGPVMVGAGSWWQLVVGGGNGSHSNSVYCVVYAFVIVCYCCSSIVVTIVYHTNVCNIHMNVVIIVAYEYIVAH